MDALQNLPASITESLRTRALIELKALRLLNFQKQVNDVAFFNFPFIQILTGTLPSINTFRIYLVTSRDGTVNEERHNIGNCA